MSSYNIGFHEDIRKLFTWLLLLSGIMINCIASNSGRHSSCQRHSLYGPRQAKKCLWTCAKCIGTDSSRACAKSHPGLCSSLIHSIVSNGSAQIMAFAVRICPKASRLI